MLRKLAIEVTHEYLVDIPDDADLEQVARMVRTSERIDWPDSIQWEEERGADPDEADFHVGQQGLTIGPRPRTPMEDEWHTFRGHRWGVTRYFMWREDVMSVPHMHVCWLTTEEADAAALLRSLLGGGARVQLFAQPESARGSTIIYSGKHYAYRVNTDLMPACRRELCWYTCECNRRVVAGFRGRDLVAVVAAMGEGP